jgi:methylenetetrahydrofolate reductase (NADPH)
MLRVFQTDLLNTDDFIITLELVPGKESVGRSVDTVMGIAKDSFSDGRISAVSITDNPGGNPSLSPDVMGYEIFKVGMDVIVHFTCRDLNRVGMESRALQLAMMGMKNLLALTGDYTGKGFGGQGAPVFDLDSVNLLMMLKQLNERMNESGDPDGFFSGCAVSPFKYTEAECFAQYAKLCRKICAGGQFVITQLGYDAYKFAELINMLQLAGIDIPVIGSTYVLTPRAARIMNRGAVPGAVVSDKLLKQVEVEWSNPKQGRNMAVERTAKLGAILKGLGYRGMHIGGIHHDFDIAGRILNRMQEIGPGWKEFLIEFDFPVCGGFYAFPKDGICDLTVPEFGKKPPPLGVSEKIHFQILKSLHGALFSFESKAAPFFGKLCGWVDGRPGAKQMIHQFESSIKKLLLGCEQCGDCGIQHVAFLCPESQCPKHTRNGACGGSRDGRCEIFPERQCVWGRAYRRWAFSGESEQMIAGCVPPRMWELNHTPSWLNFHLKRDHQSISTGLLKFCEPAECSLARSFSGQSQRNGEQQNRATHFTKIH